MCVEGILGSSEGSCFASFWLSLIDLSFIFGRVFLPVREAQLGRGSWQFVKGPLIQNLLLPLSRVDLGRVWLKLFLFLGFLCRWLTWGCCSTPAPTSVTCGISWTSLWSVGPWWLLPSRKFIFLLLPNPREWVTGGEQDLWCLWLCFSVRCSVPALFPLVAGRAGGEEKE